MIDPVPITLQVGQRRIPAGAVKEGGMWVVNAASYPEVREAHADLAKARAALEKRLVPYVSGSAFGA